MPEVLEVKFPPGCQTLPAGFWSAVDVWVRKPHVVNKRLCGARVTEDKGGGAGDLGFLDVDLLRSGLIPNEDRPWSFSVRTLIPKVHCCGSIVHKEVILKDVDRHLVSFLPCEEDAAGQIHQKKSNIYQIQLVQKDRGEWFLQLHIARPDEWLCDAVFYPKLAWLSRELLPRLVRWAAETRTSEFPSTLSLLPVEKYSLMYQQLKDKYKEMVKVWPEVTDPEKFVFEDIAIATYLLVLWAEERAETDSASKQSFVDLGCGNGLLVHILTNEGHPGKGIDVRKRKIWDMFGPGTLLEEKAITPGEGFLFPGADWLIGNHSDELTPWIPVIAARSSYSCQYFVLPCCFFDFFGKYQRRQCKKSQYKEYIDFISEVSQASGFHTEEDCLRIPSTKRVCLVGKSRNYKPTDGGEAEDRRARYIQSRRARPGSAGQASTGGGGGCLDNPETGGTGGGGWAVGFQPRDRVETVRNCAALPRDLVDGVVLQVAHALLGLNQDPNVHTASSWNHGGSLSVREVAELLRQETLQQLKKECGGLQTLLKNNHQVFRVEGGRVHIRDWRGTRGAEKKSAADAKRKPLAPGAVKTRPCWFHAHHPQGCPLQTEQCAFAHGPEDLRPSTKPLKKMKTSVS